MTDTETTYSPQQAGPERAQPDTAEAHIARLAPIEQSQMAAAHAIAAKLSPEVAATVNAIASHVHRAATISGQAAAELARLRADDLSNPAGVAKRVEELHRKAPADVQAAIDDAAIVANNVLQSQLLMGGLPTIAPEDRAAAVDEVKMLLEASGKDRITTMRAIASGSNRRHAAVVAGSWGHAALGGDDQVHHAVQVFALEGSRKYGTPEQKAYAAAYGDSGTLTVAARKAIGAAHARATHRLGGS